MEVKTRTMGIVNVPENHLLKIPAGLFGFEEYTQFALVDCKTKPFVWLQSTDNSDLAFLLIDPFLVCEDYETDIDDKELAKIGIKEPSDVLVLTLVTVPNDGSLVTTNLLGPLIINKKNMNGMQVILSEPKWTTKFNILEALKKQEGK